MAVRLLRDRGPSAEWRPIGGSHMQRVPGTSCWHLLRPARRGRRARRGCAGDGVSRHAAERARAGQPPAVAAALDCGLLDWPRRGRRRGPRGMRRAWPPGPTCGAPTARAQRLLEESRLCLRSSTHSLAFPAPLRPAARRGAPSCTFSAASVARAPATGPGPWKHFAWRRRGDVARAVDHNVRAAHSAAAAPPSTKARDSCARRRARPRAASKRPPSRRGTPTPAVLADEALEAFAAAAAPRAS